MIEHKIFKELLESPEYFRLTYPYLQDKYFSDRHQLIILKKIREYNEKYKKQPNANDLKILVEADNSISVEDSDDIYTFMESLAGVEKASDPKMIVDVTEQWCQERALENAILESVEILKKDHQNRGAIKTKVEEALSVEFDVRIGTDLFIDAPKRYEQYVEEEEIISSGLETTDKLLNGGWRKKALHIFMGRCVAGATEVTIRNKKTGKIETIKMIDLFKKQG